MATHSLESHIYRNKEIQEKIQDEAFAGKLYASLCNMQWRYKADPDVWACTWRYAGGMVANLRDQDEDYIDFYGSGNEGTIDSEIGELFTAMGWQAVPYEKTNSED